MKNNKELLDILSKEFNNGKLVSAICASPTVLYEAGITSGKKITSYPGVFKNGESGFEYLDEIVVRDNNLITSRGRCHENLAQTISIDAEPGHRDKGKDCDRGQESAATT